MSIKDWGEKVRITGYVVAKKTGQGKASGKAYHVLTVGTGKDSRELFIPTQDESIKTLFDELVELDEVVCDCEYREETRGQYKPGLLRLGRFVPKAAGEIAGSLAGGAAARRAA